MCRVADRNEGPGSVRWAQLVVVVGLLATDRGESIVGFALQAGLAIEPEEQGDDPDRDADTQHRVCPHASMSWVTYVIDRPSSTDNG